MINGISNMLEANQTADYIYPEILPLVTDLENIFREALICKFFEGKVCYEERGAV